MFLFALSIFYLTRKTWKLAFGVELGLNVFILVISMIIIYIGHILYCFS